MYSVISEFHAGKYLVMEIDRSIIEKEYNAYQIDGRIYPAISVYDLPKHIAIESNESFLGKTIECIKIDI